MRYSDILLDVLIGDSSDIWADVDNDVFAALIPVTKVFWRGTGLPDKLGMLIYPKYTPPHQFS